MNKPLKTTTTKNSKQHTQWITKSSFLLHCISRFYDHNACEKRHGRGRTGIDPKPCNPRTLQKPKRSASYPKVFLGGLPSNVTETDLRSFFGRFGKVMEVVIMYDQEKKKSRGHGHGQSIRWHGRSDGRHGTDGSGQHDARISRMGLNTAERLPSSGDIYSRGAGGAGGGPSGPTPPGAAAPPKSNDYGGYGGYAGYQQVVGWSGIGSNCLPSKHNDPEIQNWTKGRLNHSSKSDVVLKTRRATAAGGATEPRTVELKALELSVEFPTIWWLKIWVFRIWALKISWSARLQLPLPIWPVEVAPQVMVQTWAATDRRPPALLEVAATARLRQGRTSIRTGLKSRASLSNENLIMGYNRVLQQTGGDRRCFEESTSISFSENGKIRSLEIGFVEIREAESILDKGSALTWSTFDFEFDECEFDFVYEFQFDYDCDLERPNGFHPWKKPSLCKRSYPGCEMHMKQKSTHNEIYLYRPKFRSGMAPDGGEGSRQPPNGAEPRGHEAAPDTRLRTDQIRASPHPIAPIGCRVTSTRKSYYI
ncbi:unnamed protein product [Nesidiocoris tenuis]|uniref:RRM domain-containing protein n=1 Tax=Nesidiocoris tenuis TaxID=355587 RepID=A0A6H5HT79_9HEMI|nr:unnamed protein product [Nesidiocoris tenuis]